MAWQVVAYFAGSVVLAASFSAALRIGEDRDRPRRSPRRRSSRGVARLLGGRWRGGSSRNLAAVPDPLATLHVQLRLAELATELRRVEADPDVFARAHHYLAVQGAYDALLREACRLSGLPVDDAPLRADLRSGDDERFREELELSERGWSW